MQPGPAATAPNSGMPAALTTGGQRRRKVADDMSPEDWDGLLGGLAEFFAEEAREPEHAEDVLHDIDDKHHGHVTPIFNENGSQVKARCGGPGRCPVCQEELRAKQSRDEDQTVPGPEAIGHPETTPAPLETVETMTANRNPDDEPGPWDAADMGEEAWAGLRDGLLKFLAEEMAEPEHAEDAAGNAYVSRPLLNGDAVSEWAQRVGLKDVVPANKMRMAVGFSRGPVPGLDADRLAVKDADGELNGTRSVGRMRMNDTGPVVLGFYSPDVMERRRALDDSAKYRPEERPYVVIAGDPGDVDLSDVAPYSGSLEFGPEEASTLGDGQYGATGQVIFVSRKGKVLFLRRASGVAEAGEWDLPGGHVEQGEDAQVAARRESLEETGVPPPTALRLVDRVSFDGEDHTTFAAEVGKRFKPALSEEHVDWKWADPRKPPQPLRPVVAAALAAMSKSAAAPGPVAEEHFGAAVMYVEPDGRILFLKRGAGEHAGRWDLPGGRAEDGEEPEETAVREATEEAGREPKNVKLVDKGPPLAGAKDKGYFATFASKSPRFVPKISDEHSDHLWAHPARPPRPLHPGVAAVLTRIADGMGKDVQDPPGEAVDPDAIGGIVRDQPGGDNPDQDASPDQDAKSVVLGSDAEPKTLYVSRPLKNADDLIAWARAAGFKKVLPASDMHVTIAFSRTPVDWMKAGSDDYYGGKDGQAVADLVVPEGGARVLEKFGEDKDAVVLAFNSSRLAWRHEAIKTMGASWDWSEYQPHVTITYAGADVDLSEIEPYNGKLVFGPEKFAEVDENWKGRVAGKKKANGRDKEIERVVNIAVDSALRFVIAFDRKPSRKYDPDGRLHVEGVNICREGISPYVGHEIPGWEDLGLDPNKIYKLYRPADELEKAAATSNGIPLLREHRAVSADSHSYWDTVGSIGTRAKWDPPFVTNDLVVWPAADIEGVESKDKCELSPGYRYKPVMEPGKFDGEDYDGRMTEICFNHEAIVETGRQGREVIIGDSAEDLIWRSLAEMMQGTAV